jgi:hypothetical protein
MDWTEAEINLRENITVNHRLNGDRSEYSIVLSVPPSPCNQAQQEGFRIQIGHKKSIPVSLEMLERTFNEAKIHGGIYNKRVFLALYPNEAANRSCYVHVIGKLFHHAGVAVQINPRTYRLIVF